MHVLTLAHAPGCRPPVQSAQSVADYRWIYLPQPFSGRKSVRQNGWESDPGAGARADMCACAPVQLCRPPNRRCSHPQALNALKRRERLRHVSIGAPDPGRLIIVGACLGPLLSAADCPTLRRECAQWLPYIDLLLYKSSGGLVANNNASLAGLFSDDAPMDCY